MIDFQTSAAIRKRILLGVAAAAFLGPFGQTVYTPSLVEIGHHFDVDTLMVNLTISVFTAILAISSFLVGPIADSKGRRAVLIPGLAAFVAGSLICLFAPYYWVLLVGRILQAFGISTGSVVAAAVIGDIYPPAERPQAMGLFQLLTFLGPVFGPVVGGLVAGYLHWQAAFAVLAVAGLAVAVFNGMTLPETLVKRGGGGGAISLAGFGRVFGNRSARAILLLGFSQFYGYYVFLVFLPVLLGTHFTFSVSQKGIAFIPLTAGILAGITMTKRWLGHWRGTRILRLASVAIAVDILSLWVFLATDTLSVPALGAVLLVYGMLLGGSLPAQSTILVNLFSAERATAMGIYNFVRFMGAAAGPVVAALIAGRGGEAEVFLVTGGLLLLASWVIGVGIYDPHEALNRPPPAAP
jgi:MFS transporter, DHA1 family, multidrug resistance protein